VPPAFQRLVHFIEHHIGQLTEGLPPSRMRPCWAHKRNPLVKRQGGQALVQF
jgi:hypothetical protein